MNMSVHFSAILAAIVMTHDEPGGETQRTYPADVRLANAQTTCEECLENAGIDLSTGYCLPVSLIKDMQPCYTWTSDNDMTYTLCRDHLLIDEYARLASPAEFSKLLSDLAQEESARNWRRQRDAYGITAALSVALPDHVIVAAFRLPDREGMMPGQHVVIARPLGRNNADDCGDNHSHTVWYMWQQSTDSTGVRTKWVRHQGDYDLSWNRALDEFKRRIDINYGTRI